MKKWNWEIFLVSCIGALGNKSITTFIDGLILVSAFSLPLGLYLAWLTKEEK